MRLAQIHPLIVVTKCSEAGRFVTLEYCKSRREGLPCGSLVAVNWPARQIVCRCQAGAAGEVSLQDQVQQACRQLAQEGGLPRGL